MLEQSSEHKLFSTQESPLPLIPPQAKLHQKIRTIFPFFRFHFLGKVTFPITKINLSNDIRVPSDNQQVNNYQSARKRKYLWIFRNGKFDRAQLAPALHRKA